MSCGEWCLDHRPIVDKCSPCAPLRPGIMDVKNMVFRNTPGNRTEEVKHSCSSWRARHNKNAPGKAKINGPQIVSRTRVLL